MKDNIRALYLIKCLTAKAGDRIYPYGKYTYYASPYPIQPTIGEHDYRKCDSCKNAHKKIVELLKAKVKKFPNCCEAHKKLLSLKDFHKSDFKDAAKLCADKVIFTCQHIINKQSSPIWQVEISEYLDKAIESFGQFPDGYGIPFLFDNYMSFVRQLINDNEGIKSEVKDYVNRKFDDLYLEKEEKDPIADLCKIYDDWLNLVPFNLPFLRSVRDDFRNRSPLMVCVNNTSNNTPQQHLISNDHLLDLLNNLTKELLIKVGEKIVELQDGEINSFYKEFVRQELLFTNQLLDKEEKDYPYTLFIKKWMQNQENYFNKINKLYEIRIIKTEDTYPDDSYKESLQRINDFKRYIENNDVGILIDPHKKELCLQELFKLIWRDTSFDFNAEVNNGRGPLDFKVSKGNADKTIIEFKLASNTKLKQNLQSQVHIYKKANNTDKSITVLFFFTEKEEKKIDRVLEELQIKKKRNIVVIDCIKQKPSASNAKGIRNHED